MTTPFYKIDNLCVKFACKSTKEETLSSHLTSVLKDRKGESIIAHWVPITKDDAPEPDAVVLMCNNIKAFVNTGTKSHVWVGMVGWNEEMRQFNGRDADNRFGVGGEIQGVQYWAKIPIKPISRVLRHYNHGLLREGNEMYFADGNESGWRCHMRDVHGITDWSNTIFPFRLESCVHDWEQVDRYGGTGKECSKCHEYVAKEGFTREDCQQGRHYWLHVDPYKICKNCDEQQRWTRKSEGSDSLNKE